MRYAAFLKDKTGLPLLVSGGKSDGDVVSEAELMAQVLQDSFAVSADWLETASRNTAENAGYCAEILQQHGVNKAFLISHAYHMKRAVYVFKKEGLQITPAPIVSGVQDLEVSSVPGFVPTYSRLNWSTIALHEYFGLLWYRIRY